MIKAPGNHAAWRQRQNNLNSSTNRWRVRLQSHTRSAKAIASETEQVPGHFQILCVSVGPQRAGSSYIWQPQRAEALHTHYHVNENCRQILSRVALGDKCSATLESVQDPPLLTESPLTRLCFEDPFSTSDPVIPQSLGTDRGQEGAAQRWPWQLTGCTPEGFRAGMQTDHVQASW